MDCSWEGSGYETLRAPISKLKFRVDWWEKDGENVGFIFGLVGGYEEKIAELFWNGGEWLFLPCDKDGKVIASNDGLRHIDVDPARRMHLNQIEEANINDRLDRGEAVQAAMDAALMSRRREFRDDTRDLAVVGAKIYARGWYSKWCDL